VAGNDVEAQVHGTAGCFAGVAPNEMLSSQESEAGWVVGSEWS
jgi:hypothetical protein